MATTELRSLRIAPELDAGAYTAGANQKVAADKAMAASNREVAATATDTSTKISQAGDVLSRLSRQYVDGYASAQRFNSALNTLSRGIDSGRIKMAEALPILDGIYKKYGLMADAAQFATRGQLEFANAVTAANARLAAQQQITPANQIGGNAQFRRQNLIYQGFDIAQTLGPLGVGRTLIQQGPQIAQAYVGNGGVKALGEDLKGIATSAITATTAVLGTTGAIATGIGAVAVAAGAFYLATREKAKSLDDALKDEAEIVRQVGDAYGYASRQAKLMPSLDARGGDILSKASAGQLQIGINNNISQMLNDTIMKPGVFYGPTDVVVSEFEKFSDALLFLQESAKKGAPDIATFRAMVEKDWSFDPLNDGLTKAAAKLLDMTKNAMQAVNWIKTLNAATDAQFDVYRQYSASRRAGPAAKAAQDANDARVRADIAGPYGDGIPVPTPRPNDIERMDGDPFYAIQKSGETQLRQLQAQQQALGLTGAALEAFTFKQQALNAALQQNIDLGPDQIAIIDKQAKAYGEAAAALARAKLGIDLAFERDQLGRTAQDQQIAARLRGTGLGLDSPEAQQMRANQTYAEARDAGSGFARTFGQQLISSGGNIGKSFAQAFESALLDATQKAWEKLADQLGIAFANWLTGGSGASAGGAATSAFGTASGFADMIFGKGAANDNSPVASMASSIGAAGMSAYRSAIKAVESISSGGYSALGPVLKSGDQALGAYQVMASNLPSWSQAALGRTVSRSEFLGSPDIQDAVFDHQFGKYLSKYGNASDAASAWFTGGPLSSGANKMDVLGTTGSAYVDKFNAALGDASKNVMAFGGGLGKLGSALSQFPAAPAGGGGGGLLGGLGGLIGGGLSSIFSGTKAFNWLSANPGGYIGLYADGTENAPPGWAWVGEQGPELRKLRAGDVIRSNPASMRMVAANGNGNVTHFAPVFQIDARGSTMTEGQFRQIAREESQSALGTFNKQQQRAGFGTNQKRYSSNKG